MTRFTLCRPLKRRSGYPRLNGVVRVAGVDLTVSGDVSGDALSVDLDLRPVLTPVRWTDDEAKVRMTARHRGGDLLGTWRGLGRTWSVRAEQRVPTVAFGDDSPGVHGYLVVEISEVSSIVVPCAECA